MLTSVVSSSRSVAGQGQRRRQRRDPHGFGTHRARRLWRERDLALDLRQAFIGGRETVGELRLRETVLERIDRSVRLAGADFAPSVFAASIPAFGALPH